MTMQGTCSHRASTHSQDEIGRKCGRRATGYNPSGAYVVPTCDRHASGGLYALGGQLFGYGPRSSRITATTALAALAQHDAAWSR